jgi:DNA-binding protein Fis
MTIREAPAERQSGLRPSAELERCLSEWVEDMTNRASTNLYKALIRGVERVLLEAVLRNTGGNQSKAARMLGINRNTLHKQLTEHAIEEQFNAVRKVVDTSVDHAGKRIVEARD